MLVVRAQQQLSAELLRVKGLTETEAGARAAEMALREQMEGLRKVRGEG